METPNSSIRRITRSQTAASNSKNLPISKLIEESEQILSKSRKSTKSKQHQESDTNKSSPLLDITNNSPIVGLAMGGSLLTPSSSIAKKRLSRGKFSTPGSGEALLRGQVKTLLQKVEEEAVISKISLETRPIFPYLKGLNGSPMSLLHAPTPANTPQVLNLSEDSGSVKNDPGSVTGSVDFDQDVTSQVVNEKFDGEEKNEDSIESQKSIITRSLLLEFSDKSEICCASKEEEEEYDQEEYDDDEEEEEEVEECDEGSLEDLCSGIKEMSIVAVKFEGKHTRFVYNSDDEILGGEDY